MPLTWQRLVHDLVHRRELDVVALDDVDVLNAQPVHAFLAEATTSV
jgi:hypothetical protein